MSLERVTKVVSDANLHIVCYFSNRSDAELARILFRLVELQEAGRNLSIVVIVHGLRGKGLSAAFQRRFSFFPKLSLVSYRPGLDARLHRLFDFAGRLFAVFGSDGALRWAFGEFENALDMLS